MQNENCIAVVIPNYNGEEYLRKLKKPDGIDVVVMDNASTDDSVRVCKKKGFIVVTNELHVDRTANWVRCLEFFRTSNYAWMKWLFVGDELCQDVADIMNDAINRHPDAATIVFNYDIKENNSLSKWKKTDIEKKYEISDVAKELVKGDNVFGSPIAVMISKKVTDNIDFFDLHGFTWAADVLLGYQYAKAGTVWKVNETIGTFDVSNRKHYVELSNSVFATLEELELVRMITNENKDLNWGSEYENTSVYHFFLRGFSKYPKRKLLGKFIRKLIFSKAEKTGNKVY